MLLDGFPRTAEQAQALAARVPIHATVVIDDVNDKSLLHRAAERRIDPLTGAIYHLTHEPPPPDVPLERLMRRDLDDPASFKVRLDTQRAALRRVLQVLPAAQSVNGLQSPADVTTAILRILDHETPVAAPAVGAPEMTCSVW